MLKDSQHSVKAPLTTIDKLTAELKLERVDFIKMDIEGAEQRALMGAQQTLEKSPPAGARGLPRAHRSGKDPGAGAAGLVWIQNGVWSLCRSSRSHSA
jgi:hypothetical protein